MAQEPGRAKTMGDVARGFWKGLHTKFPRCCPRAPSPYFQVAPTQSRCSSSLKFEGLIEVKTVIVVILVTLTSCLLVPRVIIPRPSPTRTKASKPKAKAPSIPGLLSSTFQHAPLICS